MKSNFILFLTCLLITNLYSQDKSQLMQEGISLINQNKYSEAILSFDKSLSLDPKNGLIYFHRGTCNLMLGKPGLALVDFNRTLELDTNIHETYYNRGLAHQALKNYSFAEGDFIFYMQRKKEDVRVLKNLALLMEEMGEPIRAISYYTDLLVYQPDNVEIYKSRAMNYASAGFTDQAIADLQSCLKIKPSDSSIWMLQGNIYYDAQKYTQAIDAYNLILLDDPNHKEALTNRADAFTANKQYEDAISDYKKLSAMQKYNPEYYFNIGFCQLQLNKNEEAILSFGKALDTDYENLGQLLTFRGVAYNNLKLQLEACSDWQKAIEAGYKEAQTYKTNYCH